MGEGGKVSGLKGRRVGERMDGLWDLEEVEGMGVKDGGLLELTKADP